MSKAIEVSVLDGDNEADRTIARVMQAAATLYAGYVACPDTDVDPGVLLRTCFRRATLLDQWASDWIVTGEQPK